MGVGNVTDLELLEDFELRASEDIVKTDLELVCPFCDGVVCDAESGDSIGLLARTALGHLRENCEATP